MPSCPYRLSPQHERLPVTDVAQVCARPPATRYQVVAAPTWAGVVSWPVLFCPSWPSVFAPQQYSAPVVFTAQVWFQPAATDAQFVADEFSFTLVVTLLVLLRPSCPELLRPQHHRVPSARVAQVCASPTETLVQVV